jgi:hypothetical protein
MGRLGRQEGWRVASLPNKRVWDINGFGGWGGKEASRAHDT